MSDQIRFTFALSGAQQNEQLNVLRFEGDEGISRLYEFNIELLSANADLDIDSILQQPASLTLTQGDDSRVIQGIVSRFDAVRQVNNQVLYKARLVPRLWELSLYHTNEVYLEMTVPEIIEQVLAEAGFESVDYDLSDLQGDYKKWPYKCQYGETHLDFISRLMERDGIYYYFTTGDAGEKIIFCDDFNMQADLPKPAVEYSAAESLEINSRANVVYSFVTQQQRLPHKVLLKDYNDDSPSVDIMGEAIIDDSASKSSEIYVWGQNIETVEEGERLAEMRAEQFRAGKLMFHGESAVNRLIPGFFFKLDGHFRKVCNRDYCLLALHHEGSDKRLLESSKAESGVAYFNELTAIPADVQYRPALETHRPEIHGVLNAYVDAEGDGQYAEIDEEGRYRILLPFDRIDRDGGKASHWIRMSQPFAGERQGMHFPLRKGTEVLLTFVGGDPDRPVISGSLPNAGAPSIVNSENHTNSVIQTATGSKIEIEDKEGSNRIKFQTNQNNSYMHLGAPNHAGDGWVVVTDGIERKYIQGGQRITVLVRDADLEDGETISSKRSDNSSSAIDEYDLDTANHFQFKIKSSEGDGVSDDDMEDSDELSGKYLIERRVGDKYLWTDGNEYIYGGGNVFEFGNGYTEVHANEDGCDGDDAEVWPEGNRLGVPGVSGGEIDLDKTLVEKVWADTISYQCGNNYGYGDTADYNFGNGYEENHMDEGNEINAGHKMDKLHKGGPNPGGIKSESGLGMHSDSTWITKNFGDSYEYTDGNSLEIQYGKSEAHYYGNTWECYYGAMQERVIGATQGMYIGTVNEVALSAVTEMTAGASLETFIGAWAEMKLAAAFELCAGTKTSIDTGARTVIDATVTTEVKKEELDAASTAVSAAQNVLATANSMVENSIADVEVKKTAIAKAEAELKSAKTSLEEYQSKIVTAKASIWM
ncbi:type VI secretion system tip protein TssI/VgrG [Oceanobacter mangrovi]|uniref:type VI secretion system tip protein TssI/VgrG n=1 Tax=Oceanobacter mangrovi TaxID=2862510 RepID=UPI001C8EFB1B|nr:type VI secretion system tip protein TssI/VgrG [Oceanobacter mangrovi]